MITDNSAVIERLEKENERLRAYTGRLKETARTVLMDYECAINCLEHEDEAKESQALADDLKAVLSEAPDVSLREIKAEAGREGYLRGATHSSRLASFWPEIQAEAERYAQQIREGKE